MAVTKALHFFNQSMGKKHQQNGFVNEMKSDRIFTGFYYEDNLNLKK